MFLDALKKFKRESNNPMTRKATNSFVVLTIILFIVLQPKADKICSFTLQSCPEDFNGKTIYIPENVNSVSPEFKVCVPQTIVEGGSDGEPPSIVFIIDHSSSMTTGVGNTEANDAEGSRFLVTRALLDTLYSSYPQAEVGLVVFYDKLYFNADDDSMFQRLPDDFAAPKGLKNQAYVPLMQLDKTQKNGMTGMEYLKYILQTDTTLMSIGNGGTASAIDLIYQPTDYERELGTNITVAFDAAKFAMNASSYPKENQYFIFFSDGIARSTTNQSNSTLYDYENGVDVPATFTVYFTTSATPEAPTSLQAMTENIRENNYSTSNPSSELWAIQTNFSTLMNLVMQNIFTPMILNFTQTPTTLIINNISYTTISDSTSFYLGQNGLSLNDSIITFDIKINYSMKDDSLNVQKDTTVAVSFNVIRSDEYPMSGGITIDCTDTIYYTVSVQATDADAKEEDSSTGTITVSRNNTDGSVTVYFLRTGTATNKDDYTISAVDSVVFDDGEESVVITITPVDDTLEEGTETVTITLLDEFNSKEIRYYINSSQITASVNIEDSYVYVEPPAEPDTLTVHITPNPFSPKNSNGFSTKIRNLFENVINRNCSGMLVAVHSKVQLEIVSGTTDLFGFGYIYDAVGNLVKTIPMKKANTDAIDTVNYGFLWDCKNDNQRAVGQGTYLIKIRFKEKGGYAQVFTRKMGIKK